MNTQTEKLRLGTYKGNGAPTPSPNNDHPHPHSPPVTLSPSFCLCGSEPGRFWWRITGKPMGALRYGLCPGPSITETAMWDLCPVMCEGEGMGRSLWRGQRGTWRPTRSQPVTGHHIRLWAGMRTFQTPRPARERDDVQKSKLPQTSLCD